MSGTDIVAELLLGDPALLAIVPAERVKGGLLASDIPLPALLIREVSSVDRQQLKQGPIVRTVERISVTVRAPSYRVQKQVMRAVRAVGVGERRAIAGATSVSVRTAGRGPDMIGPGDSFEQTQDFRVSFDAAV